jgi:hypothetical protein|tara:strand:- start:189 stop:494 length:306 start_codon:yes stop_codon:yes gene_type:complete
MRFKMRKINNIDYVSKEKGTLIGVGYHLRDLSFVDDLSNEELKKALKISYNRINDNFKIKDIEIKNILNEIKNYDISNLLIATNNLIDLAVKILNKSDNLK